MAAKADHATRQIGDDALEIVTTLRAPASLVFRMWSRQEHFVRWFGPEGFTCIRCEIDFRVGGKWRATMTTPDGKEWPVRGAYREIVPDKRIVMTYEADRIDPPPVETLITIDLEAHGATTIQRFHQSGFTEVSNRDAHLGGWSSAFNKLCALSETSA